MRALVNRTGGVSVTFFGEEERMERMRDGVFSNQFVICFFKKKTPSRISEIRDDDMPVAGLEPARIISA